MENGSATLTLRGAGGHLGMMEEAKPASKKGWLLKLGVLGVVVLGAGILALRGVDLRAQMAHLRILVDQVMALIRSAGPWVFFGAMTVLPAVGFPLLGFAIPAGPAFGEQMGTGGVLAAYGAALAVNLALSYWLARYALRPLIERLVVRAGYKIPQFEPSEHLEVTLLVRIMVGPPYCVQCYLLGLGKVTFLTYMWISWIIMMLYAVGIVVFGEAIIHGRSGTAAMGVSLLIAVGIIVHLVRKHYGKRRIQSGR
jgi:uncharacterized membrane protein YdjX (TVP38/TMEM64 family)